MEKEQGMELSSHYFQLSVCCEREMHWVYVCRNAVRK